VVISSRPSRATLLHLISRFVEIFCRISQKPSSLTISNRRYGILLNEMISDCNLSKVVMKRHCISSEIHVLDGPNSRFFSNEPFEKRHESQMRYNVFYDVESYLRFMFLSEGE